MRPTEAIHYLPFRGLEPTQQIECQSPYCSGRVTLAHATAFSCLHNDGAYHMAFFCTPTCLTQAVTAGEC